MHDAERVNRRYGRIRGHEADRHICANAADPILSELDETERATLIARGEDGGLRFDIRLQGEGETTFFAV